MDSLTQIVLGGAVGEAVLGKKIGNKAILWGAIGGTIPDLDTIPGQFMDIVSRLDIHRGFSHSIIFAILIAPILGYLVRKLYKKKEATNWEWTQLFFWSIFTHPLLDIFTTWGTQFFWPFEWRIAIQSIFVIDPVYTLPFLLCLLIVLFLNRKSNARRKINRIGLIISSAYLALSVIFKLYADSVFEGFLKKEEIVYSQFESRPTPLNTILWTANIEREKDFLISYYSFFDEDKNLLTKSFFKNHELLYPYRNDADIEKLIFLTKGYYILEAKEDAIWMHDLRFGLLDGFYEGKDEFVFTYIIEPKEDGLYIHQKENSFEGMQDVMGKLWDRIIGIKSF